MIVALVDTETSGLQACRHSLLQLSIRLIDSCDVPEIIKLFAPDFSLHEHLISFTKMAPPVGRENDWEQGALRVNRIGMLDVHKNMDHQLRMSLDVSYAWAWVLKHHDQRPRTVVETIVHELQLYVNKRRPKDSNVYFMACNPSFDRAFVDRYFGALKVKNPFFYASMDLKQAFAQHYRLPFSKCTMSFMVKHLGFEKSAEAHTADADTGMMLKVIYQMFKDGYRVDYS